MMLKRMNEKYNAKLETMESYPNLAKYYIHVPRNI